MLRNKHEDIGMNVAEVLLTPPVRTERVDDVLAVFFATESMTASAVTTDPVPWRDWQL
ncbi:MAG: hypothetical protein NVSMB28_11950 [Collimonas sp.]